MRSSGLLIAVASVAAVAAFAGGVGAQLRDSTQNTDIIGTTGHPAVPAGINLSYAQEQGSSPDTHGDELMVGSSRYLIARDPGRAVRRGRQLFQRKFTQAQGLGPLTSDGLGSTGADLSRSAGFADSCAGCHGRPKGAAGSGGDVATRPDSRDAPHLFGLGLQEQLADEITSDLRGIRDAAVVEAAARHRAVTKTLSSKDVSYGAITVQANGSIDTSTVVGVNADLRVRPFFAQGGTVSIREFVVGALNAEMGLESPDSDLISAQTSRVVTPAGMVLDGTKDFVENSPAADTTADPDGDGVKDEVPVAIVDFLEFYLLNYFKPAAGKQTDQALLGRAAFSAIGCASCHVPNMKIEHDRRIADLETVYDPLQGNPFNNLFATATLLVSPNPSFPAIEGSPGGLMPTRGSFLVRNFFADLKRHDLGANFYERNYNHNVAQVSPRVEPPHDPATNFTTQFMTEPLWGVGDTAPYGHDGRSGTLDDVILRHGGEAMDARNRYARLAPVVQGWLQDFLRTLVLFGPDDTASTLNPKNEAAAGYPQVGHGSIALGAIFTTPGPE